MNNVVKGTRIRAHWLRANNPPSCLAGMQLKFGATSCDVTGVVRHFRGDHPTEPTVIAIFIDPDGDCDLPRVRPEGCSCEKPHVQVNPKWVTEILP
jgi:hypothetical protein